MAVRRRDVGGWILGGFRRGKDRLPLETTPTRGTRQEVTIGMLTMGSETIDKTAQRDRTFGRGGLTQGLQRGRRL